MRRHHALTALLAVLAVALSTVGLLGSPGAAAGSTAADGARRTPRLLWNHVDVDSQQQFRGLDVVDADTAWVSGSGGGVWRTTDGGRHWQKSMPAGRLAVYRDVEATDAVHALVLAIGVGKGSRIYRTADGGRTWRATFVNHDKRAFYDDLAMYADGEHGLAMSDPVFGKFRVLGTDDGGLSWHRLSPKGMPEAVPGEFGFAASGTSLITVGDTAYLASGGAAARVYVSRDRGLTWKVARSTIPPTPAGGVFSLAFRSPSIGVAVGGDFEQPTLGTDASAHTTTHGRTWVNGGDLGGYRSGVAYVGPKTLVAVAPTGTDISYDGGRQWRTFSDQYFDSVQCVDGSCWASGKDGSVARLETLDLQ